jgi:hypothetical protein
VDTSQHKQVEVQNPNSADDEDESEDDMSFEELANALYQAGTLASSNSKSKSKKQKKKRQTKFPTSSPYPEQPTASEDVNNHNDIPGTENMIWNMLISFYFVTLLILG